VEQMLKAWQFKLMAQRNKRGSEYHHSKAMKSIKLNSQLLTATVIMIPDKSLSFVKSKKSDNLMNFPAFLYLGFRSNAKLVHGVDILAVTMEMN